MLTGFVTTGGSAADDEPRGLLVAAFSKSGAFGTGSWMDTQPISGAVWRPKLLYGNLLEM